MVDEILIIDNSLQNYSFINEKVRVIVPQENLFVNPSWNLGVREARNEYVCLANDDIRIPNNFCTKVLEKFSDDFGVVGMDNAYVTNTRNKDNKVVIDINKVELNDSREVNFKPVKYRTHNFGIMMFFKKENYVEIPEDLKIFYKKDLLSAAYASNLDELIIKYPNIKLWCHGHVHHNCDYRINTTRIVANPRGYKNENPDFIKNGLIVSNTKNESLYKKMIVKRQD